MGLQGLLAVVVMLFVAAQLALILRLPLGASGAGNLMMTEVGNSTPRYA
jgi:hypothetical protein